MLIVICDDDRKTASLVEETILGMELPEVETEVFTSGESIYSWLGSGGKAGVYFLDIEIGSTDGVQLAGEIRKRDESALIVFMTQHREHVYKVFECLPFRFMEKPFTEKQVRKVTGECMEYMRTCRKYFFFKEGKCTHQISCDDILYFEGRGRKVCIRTKNGEQEFYGKINSVFEELDRSIFLRIHASYIVNMDAIRKVNVTDIMLSDGTVLPVSRTYRDSVQGEHMKYMLWKSGV